jgi:hypothetical protein
VSVKNKIFKVIIVLGVLFFLIVGGVLTFIIYALPSANKIGQSLSNSEKSSPMTEPKMVEIVSGDQTQAPQASTEASSQAQSQDPSAQARTEKKMSIDRRGLDQLINPEIPLSDFCPSLSRSKSGALNAADFNAEFQKSLNSQDADPRIQAIKPLFRTLFREPRMQELIEDAQSAIENKDENFWEKAAFYSKAALAFQAMLANKSELEAVSDRSYLFFKMNELIAQRPELLNDQRLQKFCEETENAFNTDQPVEFLQEKKNFERILDELGVSQEAIKYKPDYKTEFDILFDGNSLQLKGGWLEDFFSSAKPAQNK